MVLSCVSYMSTIACPASNLVSIGINDRVCIVEPQIACWLLEVNLSVTSLVSLSTTRSLNVGLFLQLHRLAQDVAFHVTRTSRSRAVSIHPGKVLPLHALRLDKALDM